MGAVEPTRHLRVFLCHSSSNKEEVRNLYRRLLADGIEPWLDVENILPGQDWNNEIVRAIRNVDTVIVCLSSQSVSKAGYFQKEIRYALDVADEQPEGAIFLIPLKLEECDIPDKLRRWQWVNLFEEDGYNRLIRALRHRERMMDVLAESFPDSSESGRQPKPIDTLESSGESALRRESGQWVTYFLESLNESVGGDSEQYKRLIDVLWMCYLGLAHRTQVEVAAILGVSESLVLDYRRRIERELRALAFAEIEQARRFEAALRARVYVLVRSL